MWRSGQLAEVSSPLPPWGFQGSESCHQAWWQVFFILWTTSASHLVLFWIPEALLKLLFASVHDWHIRERNCSYACMHVCIHAHTSIEELACTKHWHWSHIAALIVLATVGREPNYTPLERRWDTQKFPQTWMNKGSEALFPQLDCQTLHYSI